LYDGWRMMLPPAPIIVHLKFEGVNSRATFPIGRLFELNMLYEVVLILIFLVLPLTFPDQLVRPLAEVLVRWLVHPFIDCRPPFVREILAFHLEASPRLGERKKAYSLGHLYLAWLSWHWYWYWTRHGREEFTVSTEFKFGLII
jgi:hypothetical protein